MRLRLILLSVKTSRKYCLQKFEENNRIKLVLRQLMSTNNMLLRDYLSEVDAFLIQRTKID